MKVSKTNAIMLLQGEKLENLNCNLKTGMDLPVMTNGTIFYMTKKHIKDVLSFKQGTGVHSTCVIEPYKPLKIGGHAAPPHFDPSNPFNKDVFKQVDPKNTIPIALKYGKFL